MKRSSCLLAASLLGFCAPIVWAQDSILAMSGSRVRIRMTEPSANPPDRAADVHGVVGTLVRVESDTLTLKVDGTEQTLGVARSSIVKFEVSAGKRSRGKRALVGAGILTGLTAVVALTSRVSEERAYGLGYALFLGPPFGALWATLLPNPERWKELPADRIRVSVAPMRGRGVAVSLNVVF